MQSNSFSLLHAVLIWLMKLDIVCMRFVGLAHVMVHWIELHLEVLLYSIVVFEHSIFTMK